MISFRFLLVSIVAVLLALALGLVAGTAVISPRLIEQLESETTQWQARARRLQEEVDRYQSFVDESLPYLTAGRLVGTRAILVTQEDVDQALLAQARRSLERAGAQVVAVLSARAELASEDPEVRARLADALGRPPTGGGELPALAADVVATRLALGSGRRDGDPDVLRDLLEEGFLASVGPDLTDQALRDLGGPGEAVVVVAGGEGTPTLPPQGFLVPLARRLVELGATVAAGESAASSYGFVAALREDDVTAGDALVTVDDLDGTIGGVALVLGLQRLIDVGEGGHYGVSGDALIPPPPG
ncbi:MAG TPA: copper transporter [Actinomycetota bacterium]|nr:copper transporter [Actinomycetota bacterium]